MPRAGFLGRFAKRMTRGKPKRPAPDDLTRDERRELLGWIQKRSYLTRLARDREHIRMLVDACLAHHKAKGSEFSDWVAACKNWITNEYRWKHERKQSEKPQMDGPRERNFSPLAETLALFEEEKDADK
jgi:hypothetical protein